MLVEPLVTIITPVFNGEQYLDRYFENVVSLDYQNLQIIIVNDGSKDGSVNKINSAALLDKRILFINKANNEGVSKARNDALKSAEGKYLFFFDCDDTFSTDIVSKCVSKAEDEDIETVFINVANVDAEGIVHPKKMTYDRDYYTHDDAEYLVRKSIDTTFDEFYQYLAGKRTSREGKERNGPWRMMYSVNVIRRNELSFLENIRIGEDTIFTNEYVCCTKSIGLIREPLYFAHANATSAIHTYHKDCKRMLSEKIDVQNAKEELSSRVRDRNGIDISNTFGGGYYLIDYSDGLGAYWAGYIFQ